MSQVQSSTETERQSVRIVVVAEHHNDQRLDNFLLGQLKGAPRTLIYRIIRKGEVRVNGKRAKADTRLITGDKVRVPPVRLASRGEAPRAGDALATHLKKSIIYEDDCMLVLNKPAGMPVHAGTGSKLGLIEALRSMYPELPGLELVHRLDKGTSGCLLFAKTGTARRILMDAFKAHEIQKTYHALVVGTWPASLKQVDMALLRQEERGGERGRDGGGERRVMADPEGKKSTTGFRILSKFNAGTLVEAKPLTGRTHQIRVHCAESGHPLLGDDKYRNRQSDIASKKLGIHRLCLHAAKLSFRHPISGKVMMVVAEYDAAFTHSLAQLKAAG